MPGRFDPFAAFVYAGVGANRANDVLCGGGNVVGVFDDMAEGGAEVAAAFIEEAECVRVAINGAPADVVMMGNRVRAGPVEKLLFDGTAPRMSADGAVAAMMIGRPVAVHHERRRTGARIFCGLVRGEFGALESRVVLGDEERTRREAKCCIAFGAGFGESFGNDHYNSRFFVGVACPGIGIGDALIFGRIDFIE